MQHATQRVSTGQILLLPPWLAYEMSVSICTTMLMMSAFFLRNAKPEEHHVFFSFATNTMVRVPQTIVLNRHRQTLWLRMLALMQLTTDREKRSSTVCHPAMFVIALSLAPPYQSQLW